MLTRLVDFVDRYEGKLAKVTFILLSLQIVHLTWLATDVVGQQHYFDNKYLRIAMVAVDWVEVPGLAIGIATSVLSKKNRDIKSAILLGTQPIHIFWITDEFIYRALSGVVTVGIPGPFALIAIFIDYLEVPVIAKKAMDIIKARKKRVEESVTK